MHQINFTDKHLCTISLLLNNTYAKFRLYWPTLTQNITFVDQYLGTISPLLTNTYGPYHLYWLTLTQNVTFIDQHLRTILCLLTYSIVHSPSWVANVSQPVKKFPAFYGTRKFITAFTSARHLSLSWARSIHLCWRYSIHYNPHMIQRYG